MGLYSIPSSPSVRLQLHLVLSLVHYRTMVIDCAEEEWIPQLSDFMDNFYRYYPESACSRLPSDYCLPLPPSCDTRTAVRCKALDYLGTVLGDHWLTQEEPLVQRLLLPFLKPLPLDTDSDLRCQAVQLLVHLLPLASTQHALSMLALLSQVHRPIVRTLVE